jgi:hypothetical protein
MPDARKCGGQKPKFVKAPLGCAFGVDLTQRLQVRKGEIGAPDGASCICISRMLFDGHCMMVCVVTGFWLTLTGAMICSSYEQR